MEKTIARLAETINASGLSYVELEKRTKIAKSSLQRYATGKTKKIPIDAIKVIAAATGTTAAWIMGWTSEEAQKKIVLSTIHEKIKEQRLKCGYTLAEIADIIGVKEATVQRYESGEIKNIKHNTIIKLATIFNCTPAYLMGWTEEEAQKKNDVSDDIILRLRTDAELLSLFTDIAALAPEQIKVVKATVGALKQQQVDHID